MLAIAYYQPSEINSGGFHTNSNCNIFKGNFIWKQQKKLLPVKKIINFAIADVDEEEYFSIPVKT
jgi:hypothetical protein